MLALILKRPLTSALAVLALLFAALAGFQTWRADRLKGDLQTAEAQKLGAQVQARLSDKVRVVTEKLHTREVQIMEKADGAADEIAQRADGDAPLPAGLRDAHVGAIRMLREDQSADANPGASDASGGVSAP